MCGGECCEWNGDAEEYPDQHPHLRHYEGSPSFPETKSIPTGTFSAREHRESPSFRICAFQCRSKKLHRSEVRHSGDKGTPGSDYQEL